MLIVKKEISPIRKNNIIAATIQQNIIVQNENKYITLLQYVLRSFLVY